jgi:hypothetical protein
MLYSGEKESVSVSARAIKAGCSIGPGGPKCYCCVPFPVRSARPKENKSRTHKRLAFKRSVKPMWFEAN